MASSESVHPGHSLCLILGQTLKDVSELATENDTEEKGVREGAIKFILDLLGVVKEVMVQTPDLLPTMRLKVAQSLSVGYEAAQEAQFVVFDPNYTGASWGTHRLGVDCEGQLSFLSWSNGLNVQTLLIDADGQWVEKYAAADTKKLLRYATWFLDGMCREIQRCQCRVDQQLKRREVVETHKTHLRVLRNNLREAARRNQLL